MESPPSTTDSSSTALSSSPAVPQPSQAPPKNTAPTKNTKADMDRDGAIALSLSQADKLNQKKANSGAAKGGVKPVMEIIAEHFPPFDADALIVRPFEEEAARDAKFEEELSDMLLNVILKTHAWAASRPKHEAGLESRKLEEEISQIMETEREQGMSSPAPSSSFSSSSFGARVIEQTRQRLGEFVQRMKTALAALMGVP